MDDATRLVTHAQGAVECGGIAVSVALVAASGLTIALVPVTVAAAADPQTVAGCIQYIDLLLQSLLPVCTSTEVTPTERERSDTCAMACGGSQRLYLGDCYCARVPMACNDATTPDGTPPAPACLNRGNGQSVSRGRCTLGYDNGRPNGRVYRCNGSGQDWRACAAGTTLDACNANTSCL